MNVTLECSYCGNKNNQVNMDITDEVLAKTTIKCTCGRFLIRDGIMGHKGNVRKGDRVIHVNKKWHGEVVQVGKELAEVQFSRNRGIKTYDKIELIVKELAEGHQSTE